ncbi:MAG TPA: CbiX/SirB N-terminal domain-containing protein [Burkholderiales bacterium]|nr:CbiX/SirB N-terminal domain-containing protein [Burkholderiales bacterium]
MTGLILFGHGARDPRWREPFDRLKQIVAPRHDGPVELAFLEHMQPDLAAAAVTLKAAGVRHAVVVPLFLGTGGHLRQDLPAMLAAAQQASGISLSSVSAVGEDSQVLEAMAAYCVAAARGA